jgi:hypothetical protein
MVIGSARQAGGCARYLIWIKRTRLDRGTQAPPALITYRVCPLSKPSAKYKYWQEKLVLCTETVDKPVHNAPGRAKKCTAPLRFRQIGQNLYTNFSSYETAA